MNERSWRRKHFIGTVTSYICSSDDAQQIPRTTEQFLWFSQKTSCSIFPPNLTLGRRKEPSWPARTEDILLTLVAKSLDGRDRLQDKTRYCLDRRQAVSFVKAL